MNHILRYSGISDLYQGATDLYRGNLKNAARSTACGIAKGVCTAGIVAATAILAEHVLNQVAKLGADRYHDQLSNYIPLTAKIEIFCKRAGDSNVVHWEKMNIAACRESMQSYYEGMRENFGGIPGPYIPHNIVTAITESIDSSLLAGAKVQNYCYSQKVQFIECFESMVKKSYQAEVTIEKYCYSPFQTEGLISCRNSVLEMISSPLHQLFKV
jgi:hypothetical protein